MTTRHRPASDRFGELRCELWRAGAWVTATWDEREQRWYVPGERVKAKRRLASPKMPAREHHTSDELPSESQRAPSDYAQGNSVRGPSVRIGFRYLANGAQQFYWCGDKKKGEPDMVRVMWPRHEWYRLAEDDIRWPKGWLAGWDRRGFSEMEMNAFKRRKVAA